jgi:hypothetical protein
VLPVLLQLPNTGVFVPPAVGAQVGQVGELAAGLHVEDVAAGDQVRDGTEQSPYSPSWTCEEASLPPKNRAAVPKAGGGWCRVGGGDIPVGVIQHVDLGSVAMVSIQVT